MTHVTTANLGVQDFFSTTLNGNVAISDTVINLNAVPTASEGFLIIDPNNTSTREILYYNSKTSSSVTCPDATQSSSRGIGGTTVQAHTSGTLVEMRSVAEYWTALQTGASWSLSAIKDINGHTVFNIGTTGKATVGAGATQIYPYDFVYSGCVWTADAAGSTRLASMTSGVVVINGNPLTVAAVTSRTFTASKDVYVDVLDNGDGTGLLVYTDGTTNAASGALAANSIRLAIIVVGATNIATAASINQGQETALLPIASSVPYAVTDSLGNLICPRDPQRKVLGYRQITANATQTSASATQITGLSCPVIIPTGRKIKVSFLTRGLYNTTAAAAATATLWDGTVGSGTQIGASLGIINAALNGASPGNAVALVTPSSTSKTYGVGLATIGGGTATVDAAATYTACILIELV